MAKETNLVSGSPAVLFALTVMITCGDDKRLCRDGLDELKVEKLIKEKEMDRCAISKPRMSNWLPSRVLRLQVSLRRKEP